jgi:nucleotide-binding universal stress UspA family protein
MMPFKTILISARSEDRLPSLLAVSTDLAVRFKSHLIGLVVYPAPTAGSGSHPVNTDAVSLNQHRAVFLSAAQRMRHTFEVFDAGPSFSREWRMRHATTCNVPSTIIAQAQLSDLVVTENTNHARHEAMTEQSIARILLETGRPVLLLPKVMQRTDIGRQVLVAWNGTRESAKAVFDAIPLLRTAQNVVLLNITGMSMQWTDPERSTRPAELLCRALARHNVLIHPETIEISDANVGAAISSYVKAYNADLLVMGCRGSPDGDDAALGRTTRYVLRTTSVATLMSH